MCLYYTMHKRTKSQNKKTSLADIFRIIKMIKNHLLYEVKVINKAIKIAIQIF